MYNLNIADQGERFTKMSWRHQRYGEEKGNWKKRVSSEEIMEGEDPIISNGPILILDALGAVIGEPESTKSRIIIWKRSIAHAKNGGSIFERYYGTFSMELCKEYRKIWGEMTRILWGSLSTLSILVSDLASNCNIVVWKYILFKTVLVTHNKLLQIF